MLLDSELDEDQRENAMSIRTSSRNLVEYEVCFCLFVCLFVVVVVVGGGGGGGVCVCVYEAFEDQRKKSEHSHIESQLSRVPSLLACCLFVCF